MNKLISATILGLISGIAPILSQLIIKLVKNGIEKGDNWLEEFNPALSETLHKIFDPVIVEFCQCADKCEISQEQKEHVITSIETVKNALTVGDILDKKND